MSLTLRGMAQSAWNVFKYVNPVTGPYFIIKDLAANKTLQDSVKVAADASKRAVESVKEATDVVLDYPIDEGAKKAYDATARGVKVAYDETAEALDTGVKKVKEGVNRTVDAIDDAQEEARRDIADWIAPDEARPAPDVGGPPPAAATPKAPSRTPVSMPTTPAQTRAFQEQFNAWLSSPGGASARESGVSALKVDGVLGPLTRYAVAMYNMG
ncbi:MAG: hypothetical protein VKQ33_12665 [Candidatus Sericytochromatia bacterium]|nr:hypothetical protein [Candidatus Sericytochromatia bacterium]